MIRTSKRERRQQRGSRRTKLDLARAADGAEAEARKALAALGLDLTVSRTKGSFRHFQINQDGRRLLDYWPSTGKFLTQDGQHGRAADVAALLAIVPDLLAGRPLPPGDPDGTGILHEVGLKTEELLWAWPMLAEPERRRLAGQLTRAAEIVGRVADDVARLCPAA